MSLDEPLRPTAYDVENGAIVGHNGGRFNNRPLYANHRNDVVLGGDRPLIRFGRKPLLFGALMVGFRRGTVSRWLHEADDITVAYRANHLAWTITDAALPGVRLVLEVVPTVGHSGMAVQLTCHGINADDQMVWAFGGCEPSCNPNHDYDPVVHGERVTARGFVPETCRDNVVTVDQQSFYLGHQLAPGAGTVGKCTVAAVMQRADGSQAHSPEALLASTAMQLPMLVAATPACDVTCWIFCGGSAGESAAAAAVLQPAAAFAEGLRVSAELAARVVVSTPEPRLDALASASTAAIDGLWYPPVFVHSAMLWNSPFPGWRTMFGATMYGWHERVVIAAKTYLASQVTVSDKTRPQADPQRHLALQGDQSRLHGVGRITLNAGMYDMQSQFFDQLINAWRATADAELEAVLRPALDLHLEWLRECFDPDGDGVYESYINTWPTDSVWYNGGGSAEATSYAYRGHQAACDLARRAGDGRAQTHHRDALERIRSGFFSSLWIPKKGHPGKCREQGGHQRLHEDPWSYSLFLPIDAGLVTGLQAASALHYSRHALQNDLKPFGGRMVWFSNWVPGIWSVRYDWPADCYHLALAYCQVGLAADAWDIFKGTFLSSAFESSGLGNLGHLAGGTDFGDCSNTFARTLVEGLFGYRPDYPNGVVLCAPCFPSDWDHASIRLPDVSLAFQRTATVHNIVVIVARAAELLIELPVRAQRILSVTCDNHPVPWQTRAGFDETVVQVRLAQCSSARVVITTDGDVTAAIEPLIQCGQVGAPFFFHAAQRIVHVHDPEGALVELLWQDQQLTASLAANPGHHLVFVTVQVGSLEQILSVRIRIDDPRALAAAAALRVDQAPAAARWKSLDLATHLNADVRTIFQQRYLSPRPDTVSLRIGEDGWSPWTASFWNATPPTITLEHLADVRAGEPLITAQGAAFHLAATVPNIAFTSLWDNFPNSVTVPVQAAAEAIWLLVAGSTNPMQCQIANAVLRVTYVDGIEESLELVPPLNFWAVAPIAISGAAPGQAGRADYDDPMDAFCVPLPHPPCVWLGTNCRAMVYGRRLRPGISVTRVTLETLSQEVVIGLLAVSLMNPLSTNHRR